jgi:hypothetical protein
VLILEALWRTAWEAGVLFSRFCYFSVRQGFRPNRIDFSSLTFPPSVHIAPTFTFLVHLSADLWTVWTVSPTTEKIFMERETGIEPATNGLGSRYSTIELLPLCSQSISYPPCESYGQQFNSLFPLRPPSCHARYSLPQLNTGLVF